MHPRHLLAALLVVSIWGFNFVVIKVGLNHLPPLLLCALRFTLAAFPAVLFVPRPAVPLRQIAAYGMFVFALQFAFLFSGMRLGMSAGLASLTMQTQSFITIGLSALLLGERPTRFQVLGASIAFAGICVVGAHIGQDVSVTGLLVVMLAATSWSIGNLLAKKMGKVDMFALVVWASLVVPIPMLAMSLVLEGPDRIMESFQSINLTSVFAVAFIAYLSTLLGFSIWNRLLGKYPAATVAPLTLLVPVFGMLSSATLLNEELQSWKIAAFAVVISGLVVNLFGARLYERVRGREVT
jgi:O-acetylserine/cysteine efflux transporter